MLFLVLPVPCLLQAPPPLIDPPPNSPNYRTSCSFILKHTDMSVTELYIDLLQNVSDTNPLPASDIYTHWSLLVNYTLNTHKQKSTVQSMPRSSLFLCLNVCLVSLSCSCVEAAPHCFCQCSSEEALSSEKSKTDAAELL